jgi:hypothetical protein
MTIDVATVLVSLATGVLTGVTVAAFASRHQLALERFRWRHDAYLTLLREADAVLQMPEGDHAAVDARRVSVINAIWDVEMVAPHLTTVAYDIDGAISLMGDPAYELGGGLRQAIDEFREAAQRDLGTRPPVHRRLWQRWADRRLIRELEDEKRRAGHD